MTGFSDNTGASATYTYHSDGLRASKTIGDDTFRYYYNGQDVINETKNNASYATNTMGVDGIISRTQSGTVGYMFHDAHGDIKAAYGSSKTKLADYTYDAWGNQTAANTSAWSQANPIRYNGQYYDAESGMTYLRARYYDSSIQRFITEDPIKDGMNWYSYCSNNPVMFVDSSGLAGINTQLMMMPWYRQATIWSAGVNALNSLGLPMSAQLFHHFLRQFYATDITITDYWNGVNVEGSDRVDGNTFVYNLRNDPVINNEIDWLRNCAEEAGENTLYGRAVLSLNWTTDAFSV